MVYIVVRIAVIGVRLIGSSDSVDSLSAHYS